jgi:L-asparaginase
MQKKSIYVAYTGGTIGMQRSEHGYIPVSGHLQRQLALMPSFTVRRCRTSRSMNTPADGLFRYDAGRLAAHRRRYPRHYDQYDGFVILHGTDTMAFTASALSFMLENLGKPVIVTGSQIPLAELRSDGQINLLNALYVAANYPINEVALFFNNRCTAATAPPKPMPTALTPSPRPTWRRCWKPGSIFAVSARRRAARRGELIVHPSRRSRLAW